MTSTNNCTSCHCHHVREKKGCLMVVCGLKPRSVIGELVQVQRSEGYPEWCPEGKK